MTATEKFPSFEKYAVFSPGWGNGEYLHPSTNLGSGRIDYMGDSFAEADKVFRKVLNEMRELKTKPDFHNVAVTTRIFGFTGDHWIVTGC